MWEVPLEDVKEVTSRSKRLPSPGIPDNQPSPKRIRQAIFLCSRDVEDADGASNRFSAGTRTNEALSSSRSIHVSNTDNVTQDPSHVEKPSNTDVHAGLGSNILKVCTVYVDVWMSHGENTSSLFYNIAKDLGAHIIKSIGPQCTHIVYTSGCQSTVRKYFALDEERRPKVVGAAWLKDCRDAATYLGEEPYLVNLEEHRMYNLGTRRKNRSRRRRFIPSFMNDNNGNDSTISIDTSNTLDNSISVLEMARNRSRISKRK
ncbi:hypothetical protein F5051DRAFT_439311 [Lentinula edodes]|nr:hypothetical protein F5051DRAFT_439311 [Lentinula edodes]